MKAPAYPCALAALASAVIAAGALPAQALDTSGVSDTFSLLYPSRTKTFIKSSTDPDDRPTSPEAGNDDGFTGINGCESYRLRGANELAVLADIQGRSGFMGCFFRNYWSGLAGVPTIPLEENRVQLVVDGVVAHDMPLPHFYRSQNDPLGQVAPFTGFFTGSRSGGHLTHTPIAWQNDFRVQVFENSFNNAGRFHKVCGTLASPDDPVTPPDLAAWETVAAAGGGWPHLTPRQPTKTTLVVGIGDSAEITLTGPATLLELTCKVGAPADWDNLQARFTWDNLREPSVDVPLRLLGGVMRQPFSNAFSSLLLNNNGTDTFTCYLPMHFARSAQLEFVNTGPQAITLEVTHAVGTGSHPAPWGYFSAFHRRAVTQTGLPFVGPKLDDVRGMLRAIVLESSLNVMLPPPVDNKHLEGDLIVRINGNRGDDHQFAASETSIGKWGWYGSPSDLPFATDSSFNSGMHVSSVPFLQTNRVMGSTYVFDPIHFVSGIEILLEHGIQNLSNADYGLLTVFYLQPEAARVEILDLDVGDPVAEARQGVQFTEKREYDLQSHFFRDPYFGDPMLLDDVREIDSFYSFRVDVKSDRGWQGFCLGFRLDRPKNGDGGLVQADILVDGMPAGLLHSSTSNGIYQWKEGGELEVELPANLTLGKINFVVEVRPRASSLPLGIGGIKVYAYRK